MLWVHTRFKRVETDGLTKRADCGLTESETPSRNGMRSCLLSLG